MSSEAPIPDKPAPPSVFLSYASEDRKAAQALRDALPTYGLEVWYDESGLDGGDAWDQKIRRQIRECDFFMPVISANTEVRPEGYFRREWRLAVERTLDMADDHTFLLPVVIDETGEAGARVPERFLTVQWMRVPGGQPTPALEARCRRLVSRENAVPPPRRSAEQSSAPAPRAPRPGRPYPEFPREEPGQRIRFWAHVIGWALRCVWIAFMSLPKWVRIVAYGWLAVVLLSKGCTSSGEHSHRVSSAEAARIRQIASNYQGSANKADVAKLGTQIANALSEEGEGSDSADQARGAHSPLLAIPFSAPPNDPAAQKLADSTFAQLYGGIAIAQHGAVGLSVEPLSALDANAALAQARNQQAKYVLYGGIDNRSQPPTLAIALLSVADGAALWSGAYPTTNADPAHIAADVAAKIRSLADD
jgi:TolB-like protein